MRRARRTRKRTQVSEIPDAINSAHHYLTHYTTLMSWWHTHHCLTNPFGAAATRSRSKTYAAGGQGSNSAATKPTTIGYKFKNQLAGLYEDILSTNPHYIRCVKPNANKAALDFDNVMVMEQLKCNGTLEMVRIRREGYPIRETWEFLWKVSEINPCPPPII